MLEIQTIFDDEQKNNAYAHRVTNIKEAVRDRNRVNIYIDSKYYCSLDISQVVDDEVISAGQEEVDVLEHLSGDELENGLLVRIFRVLETQLFSRTEIVRLDECPEVGQELFCRMQDSRH